MKDLHSPLEIFLLSSAPALGVILNLQSKLHSGLEKIRELRICIYKDGWGAELQVKASPKERTDMHILIHYTAPQLFLQEKVFSGSSQKLFYQNSL